jgi:hypothetical protein
MDSNLSILQENTLEILRQIEYVLDVSDYPKDGKTRITFGDIDFSVLRKAEDLCSVAEFLKEKKINFELTFDLVNENPASYVSKDCPEEDDVELGYIKDKNANTIKEKILRLKSEILKSQDNEKNFKQKDKDLKIKKLEVKWSDRNDEKKIIVYINDLYNKSHEFKKGKYWGKIYELAMDKKTAHNEGFYSYFNSNSNNPIYTRTGLKLTQILKKDSTELVPNIEINIITGKQVATRSNRLKKT